MIRVSTHAGAGIRESNAARLLLRLYRGTGGTAERESGIVYVRRRKLPPPDAGAVMLGRGASADQDARFGNKMKKLKSTMHFENALSTKVRTSQQLESTQRRLTSLGRGPRRST